jgi:hypothetical protein
MQTYLPRRRNVRRDVTMLSRTPALGGNKKFVIDFTLSIQTSTGRVVSPVQRGLGFRIDDADGNWIVMGSHAVHTEAKQGEVPVAPSEGTVNMPLYFELTVVRSRQVV